MDNLLEQIARATRLTREGKLGAATSAIRRALGGLRPRGMATASQAPAARGSADIIDVVAHEAPTRSPQREPASRTRRPSGFSAHYFAFEQKRYRYRLFVPCSMTTTGIGPPSAFGTNKR